MSRRTRLALVAGLVISVTFLQYFTRVNAYRHHILYEGLYFIPIILAGFWFGLRAAVSVSLTIVLLYVPFLFLSWTNFSGYELTYVMDLVIYVAAAALIGYLREREWAEESRAREAERLAAMGKALSALAHDLKTPLIAIGGFCRLVQKRMSPEDPLREKMEIIAQESGRLENMMVDILDFARPLKLNVEREDIRKTITHTLSIAEPIAEKKSVPLRMRFPANLPIFSFDRSRLEEALLNLVKNAIDASPPGEVVWVEAYPHGSHLNIEVVDRGNGIPRDIRDHIFEPFLTTKQGGTGLGLPIARKIVESHGGRIEVIHNGKGTTFKVSIPTD